MSEPSLSQQVLEANSAIKRKNSDPSASLSAKKRKLSVESSSMQNGEISSLEHSSLFGENPTAKPLTWLQHHEKLLDLNKWVDLLTAGKKTLTGWKYQVFYRTKDGSSKRGIYDCYFVSSRGKKLRTRREVAYYLNLDLTTKSETSRIEESKYAFQKNLNIVTVEEFETYDQVKLTFDQEQDESMTDRQSDEETVVVDRDSLLAEELSFLTNEDIFKYDVLQKRAKKKLKQLKDKILEQYPKKTSFRFLVQDQLPKNPETWEEKSKRYFLRGTGGFLAGQRFVKYDLQRSPLKGCGVVLNTELVFGDTIISNLGYICAAPGFHSKENIFPIGYQSRCKFLTRRTFNDLVFYHNHILDSNSEGGGPVFQVVDDLGKKFEGSSAKDVWKQVINNFMNEFNEKCKKIAQITEVLSSTKKPKTETSTLDSRKRKVRHIITGLVTRIHNRFLKCSENNVPIDLTEFDLTLAAFTRFRSRINSGGVEELDPCCSESADEDKEEIVTEAEEMWWECNVDYTLRSDLGDYFYGLDRLEVKHIVEGLPGVHVCCPDYIYIVQRDTYKKSFNVKDSKKLASNVSRVSRGFAKLKKHIDSIEKRSEVANKRFMKLEDDLMRLVVKKDRPRLDDRKDKKSDMEAVVAVPNGTIIVNEFGQEMIYVNGVQMPIKESKNLGILPNVKQISAKKGGAIVVKKSVDPLLERQNDILEELKGMTKIISLLSNNLQDYVLAKLPHDLIPDFHLLVLPDGNFSPFALVPFQPVDILKGPEFESFVGVYNFVSLFAPLLGLCQDPVTKYGIVNHKLDQNQLVNMFKENEVEVKLNARLHAENEKACLNYRKDMIEKREDMMRKKRSKTPDEKDKEEKMESDDEAEKASEGENEDEFDMEEASSDAGGEKGDFMKETTLYSSSTGKKNKKMITVEHIPDRPTMLVKEFAKWFETTDYDVMLPIFYGLLGLCSADFDPLMKERMESLRESRGRLSVITDSLGLYKELKGFRSIALNRFTFTEASRITIALFYEGDLSLKEDYASSTLFYSNKIHQNLNFKAVKAKNFNIDGRKSVPPKNATERELEEYHKVQKHCQLKNLILRPINERIQKLNLVGGTDLKITPNVEVKQPKTGDNCFGIALFENWSEEFNLYLPAWLVKLLGIREVGLNRVLRMRKILNEVIVELARFGDDLKEVSETLLSFSEFTAREIKENVLLFLEKFFMKDVLKRTALTSEQKKKCRFITRLLANDEMAVAFCSPVDTAAYTDYLKHVTTPMDLQTVDFNLSKDTYHYLESYVADMRRVWLNCLSYNPRKSDIALAAGNLGLNFELVFSVIFNDLENPSENTQLHKNTSLIKILRMCKDKHLEVNDLDKLSCELISAPWDKNAAEQGIVPITEVSREKELEDSIDIFTELRTLATESASNSNFRSSVKSSDDTPGLPLYLANTLSSIEGVIWLNKMYDNLGCIVEPMNDEPEPAVCQSVPSELTLEVYSITNSSHVTISVDQLESRTKSRKHLGSPNPLLGFNDKEFGNILLEQLLYTDYESLDRRSRLSVLEILCAITGQSNMFKQETEDRQQIMVETMKRWRLNPPIIKFRRKENHPNFNLISTVKAEAEPEMPAPKLEMTSPSETDMNWEGCYPGTPADDILTDQVSLQLHSINNKLWQITHDSTLVISRALVTGFNRVERELARCYRKSVRRHEEKTWRVELSSRLSHFNCRLQILGMDRFWNKYYIFPMEPDSIYIEPNEVKVLSLSFPENKRASLQGRLLHNPVKQWSIIRGRSEIGKLIACLSNKTDREGALRFQIMRRAPLFERQGNLTEEEMESKIYGFSKTYENLKKGKITNHEVKIKEFVVPFDVEEVYNNTQSAERLGAESVEEHVSFLVAARLARISVFEKFEEENRQVVTDCLLVCRVILLNMEKFCYLCKEETGNARSWFDGCRRGWLRLLACCPSFEALKQATVFMEDKFEKEKVSIDDWYEQFYGDCTLAMMARTPGALLCRLLALDSAIQYKSLFRRKSSKKNTRAKGKRKR